MLIHVGIHLHCFSTYDKQGHKAKHYQKECVFFIVEQDGLHSFR